MKYTGSSHINNIDEVRAFGSYLVNDLGVNFHSPNANQLIEHLKIEGHRLTDIIDELEDVEPM